MHNPLLATHLSALQPITPTMVKDTFASPEGQSSARLSQRSSGQQRRSKRKVVFDEKQTEDERRLLRVEQRHINQVLVTGGYRTRGKAEAKEETVGDDPLARPTLEGVRESNNELFNNVTYTRELVLDADNVALLANNYAKQVEESVQVRSLPLFSRHCRLLIMRLTLLIICLSEGTSLRCCEADSSIEKAVHFTERKQ